MCSAFQETGAIEPIDRGGNSQLGEQKAQSCDNAGFRKPSLQSNRNSTGS
jgi:hypothetical protein